MEIRRKPWFVPAVKKSWEKCMEKKGKDWILQWRYWETLPFLQENLMRFSIAYWPKESRETYRILVPQDAEWEGMIEQYYGTRCRKITRYRMKKEPGIFLREILEKAAASIPEGVTLVCMDEALFYLSREQEWSRDFTALYEDFVVFKKLGLGSS